MRDGAVTAQKETRQPPRASTAERPTAESGKSRWAIPTGLVLLTIVAFLPVLRNGFVSWDDDRNFVENPHFRGLGLEQLRWMWTTCHMGHYVPLSWMTLGLDYAWGIRHRLPPDEPSCTRRIRWSSFARGARAESARVLDRTAFLARRRGGVCRTRLRTASAASRIRRVGHGAPGRVVGTLLLLEHSHLFAFARDDGEPSRRLDRALALLVRVALQGDGNEPARRAAHPQRLSTSAARRNGRVV